MKAIKIKLTRKGQFRAYYYSRQLFRWMPIPLAKAEAMLAAGTAFRVPADQDFA